VDNAYEGLGFEDDGDGAVFVDDGSEVYEESVVEDGQALGSEERDVYDTATRKRKRPSDDHTEYHSTADVGDESDIEARLAEQALPPRKRSKGGGSKAYMPRPTLSAVGESSTSDIEAKLAKEAFPQSRKKRAPADLPQSPPAVQANSTQRRGRGRPRKDVSAEGGSKQAASQKPRGRKRKATSDVVGDDDGYNEHGEKEAHPDEGADALPTAAASTASSSRAKRVASRRKADRANIDDSIAEPSPPSTRRASAARTRTTRLKQK